MLKPFWKAVNNLDWRDDIDYWSVCSWRRRMLMTREDILRQIAVLQTQLEEFDKVERRASVDAVITEAEKEKQH